MVPVREARDWDEIDDLVIVSREIPVVTKAVVLCEVVATLVVDWAVVSEAVVGAVFVDMVAINPVVD